MGLYIHEAEFALRKNMLEGLFKVRFRVETLVGEATYLCPLCYRKATQIELLQEEVKIGKFGRGSLMFDNLSGLCLYEGELFQFHLKQLFWDFNSSPV